MFIGDDTDAHKSATQKLMDAAVHFRRASEALMAAQALAADPVQKDKLRSMRVTADSNSVILDVMFQESAQRYFA